MSTPSATEIRDIAYYWINNLKRYEQDHQGRMVVVREGTPDKILRAYRQKGPWEGWAQLELATLFEQKLERDYVVSRGDLVFHNSNGTGYKPADIVLLRRSDPSKKLIINLKVQSKGKDGTGGASAIAKELKETAARMQRELRADLKPAKCMALGISCTTDAAVELGKVSNGLVRQKCWGPVPSPDGKSVTGPIFIFWYEMNL